MPRVRRSDVTKLDGATRTPEGYIDTYGNLTRTGVFEYRRADGSVQRELRLPEHVFNPASIASANGQPLTLQHPMQNLDARSFKRHTVGFVFEPHKADDGEHLRARVRIMDADAVRAVESGVKELSNGYETTLIPLDGGVFKRDDFNGGSEVRADFLQTEILINHTALVDRGRAGPSARLDSAGNQGAQTMNEEEKKAFDAAIAEAAKAKAESAAEKARADAAEGKVATYEAEKAKAAAEAASKAKAELVAQVAVIAKKDAAELEKLDERALLLEALAVMQPAIKADGWNDGMLRGAFETALAIEATRTDSASDMARVVAGVKKTDKNLDAEDENASENAYRKAREIASNAWRTQNKA
jgi:hypothetical protein